MFRAFLDQGLERRRWVPRRIRAHAASLALHALGLVLLLLLARHLDPPEEPPSGSPGLVVSLFQPVALAGAPANIAPARAVAASPVPARRRISDRPLAIRAPRPAPAPAALPLDDGGSLPLARGD